MWKMSENSGLEHEKIFSKNTFFRAARRFFEGVKE